MKHLVTLDGLDALEIRNMIDQAKAWKKNPSEATGLLAGRILCCAFFEPSTRTRLSFEAAAHRLGAQVIGFSGAASTSAAKGETLEDSMRVLSGYGDAIILRHPTTGAALDAAAVAGVPVINAGDGAGEHPTQTLVDLMTLEESLGGLEGRKFALIGDLRYGRTVHSLAPALQQMGATVVQVPAGDLRLPDGFEVPVVSLEEAATSCDALYVTRVQKERFDDDATYKAAAGTIRVDAALLDRTGSKAIVLHPLPRVDEIATDVDALPAAKYFEQARNGVPIRMAVLHRLLENKP